jgi:hypothetical protein
MPCMLAGPVLEHVFLKVHEEGRAQIFFGQYRLSIPAAGHCHSHSKPFLWLLLSVPAWRQPVMLFLFSGC